MSADPNTSWPRWLVAFLLGGGTLVAASLLWLAQRGSELRCLFDKLSDRVRRLESERAFRLAKRLRITPKDWSDDKLKTRVASSTRKTPKA